MSKFTVMLICLGFLALAIFVQGQNVCKGNTYSCEVYQTCCKFNDDNYGCCPYAYANCCEGTNACCQSGFKCQANGTGCIRMENNS